MWTHSKTKPGESRVLMVGIFRRIYREARASNQKGINFTFFSRFSLLLRLSSLDKMIKCLAMRLNRPSKGLSYHAGYIYMAVILRGSTAFESKGHGS
jgi:hypothetical protein